MHKSVCGWSKGNRFSGLGFEIGFDENSDKIHIPSKLNRMEKRLQISMPNDMKNSTAQITIERFQNSIGVEFRTVFLRLNDKVNVAKWKFELSQENQRGKSWRAR